MRLDVPNIDRIVAANSLPVISNPMYLDKDARPLDDGLYSYAIFGRLGSEQRRTQFAHVDLRAPFFHPTVYGSLVKLDRGIGRIVSGTRWVRITKGGELQEAEPGETGAGTGIDFLHRNWGKWRLKSTGVESREERLDFVFAFPREEAFVTRWLVIPPHFRDIDTSSGKAISTDVLTGLYSKLIGAVTTVDRSADIQLTGDLARSRVQELLMDIYAYFTVGITLRDGSLEKKGNTGIAGKRGLIHRSLLAKNIDYTARAVISGPDVASKDYKGQQVPYGYTGLPIHVCLACFFPLVQHELSNYVAAHSGSDLVVVDGKKETKITTDSIKKLVKLFIGTQEKRLLPVRIASRQTGKGVEPDVFKEEVGREMTLADLFYMLAERSINGGDVPKHVLVTRYPIEDYRNVIITRVRIMVTEKDGPRKIGALSFDHYPNLEGDATRWVDSIRPHNGYLPGLGGDFDGDMVSVKGLFTQEANEEAAKLVLKKASLLNASGGPSRVLGNEAVVSLFAMTR